MEKRAIETMHTSVRGLEFLYRHEAQKGVSEHLYWPYGASGVTLGAGYDMKDRDAASIIADMRRISLPAATAQAVSAAAGLTSKTDPTAKQFAADNHDLVSLSHRQETQLLAIVIPRFETNVRRHITVGLEQHQFDALVSFVYNIGSFLSVARAINTGETAEAMNIMRRFVYSGGVKLQNLVDRRADEVTLYTTGFYVRKARHPKHQTGQNADQGAATH